jgi:uncharacterized protein (DUF952 family)
MCDDRPMSAIYHIASAAQVEQAARAGQYVPAAFATEGFIHCSHAHQVKGVAQAYFAGQRDLVLVEIDPSKLTCPVLDENLSGGSDLYPHIYGPLPMAAVISVRELPCGADGSLILPCNLSAAPDAAADV